ncbi:MAG: DNA mismatch repair endonuclease MutL, partial [Elusimicrobiota bacterium]|nr:DNA mismatch repair endonuclease MutL [Elusimicrobiota bacterium]
MPEIKVLPEDVVSKIAAGEVIERPASVLKELIENSLDAGASKIEIEVKKAGRGLIRVHDDGRGMDREDLRLALGRHATSKLSVFEDIYSLATFGFRGEALYSVFAVSRLKITSFRAGADSGYAIEGEGGRVIA